MTLPEPVAPDRVLRTAPLGLRFWDDATRRYVGDGLAVEAYLATSPRRRRSAAAGPSSVWAFDALPSLRDPPLPPPPSGVGAGQVTIAVADREGRFQPFSLQVNVPARGAYAFSCPGPSPLSALSPWSWGGAVRLQSAPARRLPAGLAVVRAELFRPGGAAAAHAVLRARIGSAVDALGVADAMGRVVVVFPYPPPRAAVPKPPLATAEWTVELTAYDAGRAPSDAPDLCATFSQPQVPSQVTASRLLRFGQELDLGRVRAG